MKYRVAFNFWSIHGRYYTEWFDTYQEAWDFVEKGRDHVYMMAILDENDKAVTRADIEGDDSLTLP